MEVPLEDARRYGIIRLNQFSEVVEFVEKPPRPQSNLASMGIYLFDKRVLAEVLTRDATDPSSSHDFGRDIFPYMLGKYKVYAYRFNGYWRDVGTVQSYWEANMDLLSDRPLLDLYNPEHPVLARPQSRPPSKSGPNAMITSSLVCDGCVIKGVVRHSVLSRGVQVEEGAVVEDSIIFDDCYIEAGAIVHRSIIDKEVKVGRASVVGWGEDFTPNQDEPDHLNTGITLVGKRATVPPGVKLGRNCKVYPGTPADAFRQEVIPSGSTVGKPLPR